MGWSVIKGFIEVRGYWRKEFAVVMCWGHDTLRATQTVYDNCGLQLSDPCNSSI